MQRPRTPFKLSESLHQRLNSYALAASAAGVGMVALAQPVEAKIVYTKTHVKIFGYGNHAIYHLDLNRDKQIDFTILNISGSSGVSFTKDFLYAKGKGSNGVECNQSGRFGLALALPKSSRVSSGEKFCQGGELESVRSSGATSRRSYGGYWKNVSNRYLGLKFTIKGLLHYGWARLSVQIKHASRKNPESHSELITATLTGYAYETIPNKSIIAGKTKGADEQDGASLGALAAGSPVLSRSRKKAGGK